ncbi:MAG: DUF393 domain-containing protein [Synechococcaceae cyanobacterium RL_1_2]|nr:DUF393 domain-containing protein [Synechococcaceae cyanobacterium RL_1_2]
MADSYNPEHYCGVTFAAAMDRIHGILPDGTVLKNVAVFRSVYQALGMGWVYGITQIPVIGAIADFIYGIWAKYRLQLTGRPDLITLIQEREQRLNCKDQGCAVVRE